MFCFCTTKAQTTHFQSTNFCVKKKKEMDDNQLLKSHFSKIPMCFRGSVFLGGYTFRFKPLQKKNPPKFTITE